MNATLGSERRLKIKSTVFKNKPRLSGATSGHQADLPSDNGLEKAL
jgi:hypothetical protein